MIKVLFRSNLALLLILIFMCGCTSNMPYHTLESDTCQSPSARQCMEAILEEYAKGNDPEASLDQCDEQAAKSCMGSYYQRHDMYDIAFAEFSERGNAFNEAYIDYVKKQIADHAKADGVVLVIFVHGWKHNANEIDSNLLDFKLVLKSVAENLEKISNGKDVKRRRLVGLYIGWRGASTSLPVLENATFWDRKAVAEEVGKGGVTRLLLELALIDEGRGSDNRKERNVMVVVGHSFGAAIVVSALSEVLTERTVFRTKQHNYGAVLGDAVIVLNPAIEANQALNLVEVAREENYPENQHPMLVSISTDADWPTHNLFPFGQTVGLFLTWKQTDLARNYYVDRKQGDAVIPLREEHLDATTVGNFAPFLTHRLELNKELSPPRFSLLKCKQVPKKCGPKGLTSLDGLPTIKPLPENYPLYFIKTNETVMSGHNDIFNESITAFMLTIIDDVVSRNLLAKPEPTILSNPNLLNERANSFLKTLCHQKGKGSVQECIR
ncbi:MAG: hypothetical protein JAY90_20890 [Candidatus Thiodiazotropha lotti]|nr:hypothetical protein [Candidatus Thiodiazotropha lotti]